MLSRGCFQCEMALFYFIKFLTLMLQKSEGSRAKAPRVKL